MGYCSWLDCQDRSQILIDDPRPVYVLVPEQFRTTYGDKGAEHHIKENRYNGYGEFGGYDIYDLAAEWNREALRVQIGIPDITIEKDRLSETHSAQVTERIKELIEPEPKLESFCGLYGFEKKELAKNGATEEQIAKADEEHRMGNYKAEVDRYNMKVERIRQWLSHTFDEEGMRARYGKDYQREIGINIAHGNERNKALPFPIEVTHNAEAEFNRDTPSLTDPGQGYPEEMHKLTVEDITNVKYISSMYNTATLTETSTFEADIESEHRTLLYELSRHDDGELTFSIHAEGIDLWDMMDEEDLNMLDGVLYEEKTVGRYAAKVNAAATQEALSNVRYEFMEDMSVTGETAERIKRILAGKETALSGAGPEDVMDRIRDAVEDMDTKCDIRKSEALIEFWSGNGQDIPVELEYDGTAEGLAKKFREYAEGYDVDSEVETFIGMRGQNGVPGTVREILEDCEEAKEKLMKIADEIDGVIREYNPQLDEDIDRY